MTAAPALVEPSATPLAPVMPLGALEAEIARVDVFVSLPEAHRDWVDLETTVCASPYQSFAFAEAWFSTVGAATGAQPFIVVAREASGQPAALLPLARRRLGPLSVAAFHGGKDSNFNLGLYRPDRLWSAGALRSLLRAAARATPARVDCFALLNQPRSWQGVRNPICALGGRPSPSFAYKSELPLSFAAWRDAHDSKEAQKKLRKLARRLEGIGPIAHVVARDEAEALRILDAFIDEKRQRTRAGGPASPYASEPARAFLGRLAIQGLAEGRPALELHALRLGDRIVATFGALPGGGRLSGLILAYDSHPDVARCGPGRLLLRNVVRSAIERGFETFDLGVGEARYKNEVCESTEALFDSFVPASALGRAATPAFVFKQNLKRRAKRSPLAAAAAARLGAALRGAFNRPLREPAAAGGSQSR